MTNTSGKTVMVTSNDCANIRLDYLIEGSLYENDQQLIQMLIDQLSKKEEYMLLSISLIKINNGVMHFVPYAIMDKPNEVLETRYEKYHEMVLHIQSEECTATDMGYYDEEVTRTIRTGKYTSSSEDDYM